MLRKVLFVLALTMVTLAGGCAMNGVSRADRSARHYASAAVLMDDFQVEAALAELNKAIALDDKMVLAYANLYREIQA